MKLEWNDTKDCMTAYYRGHIIHIDKKLEYGVYELTVRIAEKMNMEFLKAVESGNEDVRKIFEHWRDVVDVFVRHSPDMIKPDSKEVGDGVDYIDNVADWLASRLYMLGDSQSSIRDKFVGELSKGE